MAFSAEVTGGAATGAQGAKTTNNNVEFSRNVFIRTTKTSNAKIPEKDLGRGIAERWRKRKEKKGDVESKAPPEKISFKEDTRSRMKTHLNDIATDIYHDIKKPGGMDNLLPHERALIEALDINIDTLDENTLKQNLNAMLNTAEGWIVAKAVLDQTLALKAFARGISYFGGQAGDKQESFSKVLRRYSDDEGAIHQLGRSAGQGLVKHWQIASTAGLTAAAFFGTTVATGGNVVLGGLAAGAVITSAAGIKGGESSMRRGRRLTEAEAEGRACAEALQVIQNNENLRRYMKRVAGMDANDYIVQNGRVVRNPTIAPEDRGTRVDSRDYLEGLMDLTVTRQLYYRDLHVPLSQQYAQAEQFLISGSGFFDLSGDRVHSDTLDIWQNLRRAQTTERRRRGPDQEKKDDEETRRANLLRDVSGRGVDSPLHGRDYPKGVEPPPFAPENVLDEQLDQWGQAKQDDTTFSPDIVFSATHAIEDAVLPQGQNPLERRRSDWYGRAPAERVFFLGTHAVPFGTRSGENVTYTLRRVGMPHPQHPDTTIHAVDSNGSKFYEYDYHGEKKIEISIKEAEQQIFYITDGGERVPIGDDTQIRKTTNLTTAEYEFQDTNGNWSIIDSKDMFYIPRSGTDAPIPFGQLRDVPTNPYNPGDPVAFAFDPKNGPFQPVQVAENKFFLVNPGAAPSSMENYPENPNFIENFHRDNWFIPPDESLTPLDPNNGRQALLYGRDFPSSRLAIMDRLVRSGVLDEGITIDELQSYVTGGILPPDKQAIISTVAGGRRPRAKGFKARVAATIGHQTPEQRAWDANRRLRELQPFAETNFKARDSDNLSPADIRFGISDPDILAALNVLLPANLSTHLPALEATGQDQWGQLPGDPFFCRADRKHFQYYDSNGTLQTANLNEKIDFDKIDIDSWGQRKTYYVNGQDTGEVNPFFMIQDENEVAATENTTQNDLELWIKAREIALGNVTEDLIRKLRKVPLRNRSIIQAKHNARKEGGKNLQQRIERAGKDKPVFATAKNILEDKIESIDAHKNATAKLAEAQTKLPQYIVDTFSSNLSPQDAKDLLERVRTDPTAPPLTLTIDGNSLSIKSLEKRKQDAGVAHSTEYQRIEGANKGKSRDSYEKLLDRVDDAYNQALEKIMADEKLLRSVQAEIASFEVTIKNNTKDLDPTGDIAKDREAALHPQGNDQAETAALIALLPAAELQTGSLTQLLTLINAENTADENRGWPAVENSSEETLKILVYAMLKGRVDERIAVAAAATPSITLTDTDDLREEILQQLMRQADRQLLKITNLETTVKDDPELKGENVLIDVTDAGMSRQPIIFGMTASFMSRINQTVPIEGNAPRTVADLPDAEKNALKDKDIGLDIPDTTPVYILEIYDVICGWRGRADQKQFLKAIYDSLPPEELVRLLLINAPETIPPLRTDVVGFGVDLNRRVGDPQTGLQISRSALRHMFIGVLDHLEESSLALYDPTEVFDNATEAARIRRTNLRLPNPSLN